MNSKEALAELYWGTDESDKMKLAWEIVRQDLNDLEKLKIKYQVSKKYDISDTKILNDLKDIL